MTNIETKHGQIEHYILGKTLGVGSFGKVKRITTSDFE